MLPSQSHVHKGCPRILKQTSPDKKGEVGSTFALNDRNKEYKEFQTATKNIEVLICTEKNIYVSNC